jgi:hypothetical protein
MKTPRRIRFGQIVFAITACGGVVLLAMAVWPGLIEATLFDIPIVLLTLPGLGLWFLLLNVLGLADLVRPPQPGQQRRRWGLISAAIMYATLGLLRLHVPQRVVFLFCFSALQPLVETAPDIRNGEAELGRHVGPYVVDRYGADPRGGVYFRTATGPDGLSPDTFSYGFVDRPNREGTPFGNARYGLRHLFGNWYWFAASDDW